MTWIKLITDFNRFFFRSVFVYVLYGSRLRCCVWERSAAVKKNSSGGGVGVDPCSTAGEGGQAPGRHCAVLQPSSVPRVPHSTTDHIQSWTARLCCTFFDSKPIQTSEVSLLIVNFLFFLNVVHETALEMGSDLQQSHPSSSLWYSTVHLGHLLSSLCGA